MGLLRGLLSWLGLERPSSRVSLRPHRAVELPLSLQAAHRRCLDALDSVLGATVYADEVHDEQGSAFIEAGFGLVQSERLRVFLNRIGDTHTNARIEAIYPANITSSERSLAVETLAETLQRSTRE